MDKPTEPMTLLTVMCASKFLDVELVRWQTTYPDGRRETKWELCHYGTIRRLDSFKWKQYQIDDEL